MRKEWHKLGNFYLQTKCPYMRNMPNGFRVPCGHCYYCRKNTARELAFRCKEEAFDMFTYNCLITYDDEHLYFKGGDMSLNKLHFQEFMKRFRYHMFEKFGVRLRFFCVGEYGGKKGRPHYHMILFSPLQLHGKDYDGCEPFSALSTMLEMCWKKGACDAELMKNTGGSVRYLVQYLISTNDSRDHREKPFRLMSRGNSKSGYGLGYRWIQRNKELLYKLSQEDVKGATSFELFNGHTIIIPRYYHKKYLSESQLIARADDYYHSGKEYEFYLQNLFENGNKKAYVRELDNYREREKFTAQRAYREAKIHDNARSAGRLFAQSARARKG